MKAVRVDLSSLFSRSERTWRRITRFGSGLLQWGRSDVAAPTLGARTPARSAAYENLVRRTFAARGRAELADQRLSRFVPKPFHEAFDHPQSRADADGASLARDLLGRGGFVLGFITIAMTALFVALASGLYAPGGKVAVKPATVVPGPAMQDPIKPALPGGQQQRTFAPGGSKG